MHNFNQAFAYIRLETWNGEGFDIPLTEVQMKAIKWILGLKIGIENDGAVTVSNYSDESVLNILQVCQKNITTKSRQNKELDG